MEDSRAISPEVKGLYDTIRNQAHEYAEAFESFSQMRTTMSEDFDTYIHELTKLRTDFEVDFASLRKYVLDIVKDIELKSEKTLEIYSQLSEIKALNNTLSEHSKRTERYFADFDSLISEVKTKTDEKFNISYNAIKTKLEKDVEDMAYRIEVRLSLKLKQFESSINSQEQKILNFNDKNSKTTAEINNEIDAIRNVVAKLKVSMAKDLELGDISAYNSGVNQLEQKVVKLEETLKRYKNFTEKFNINDYFDKSEFFREIADVRAKNSDLEKNLNIAKKKLQNTAMLAAIAVGGFILAILIAIVK